MTGSPSKRVVLIIVGSLIIIALCAAVVLLCPVAVDGVPWWNTLF